MPCVGRGKAESADFVIRGSAEAIVCKIEGR